MRTAVQILDYGRASSEAQRKIIIIKTIYSSDTRVSIQISQAQKLQFFPQNKFKVYVY